jgi:hypothetical protein
LVETAFLQRAVAIQICKLPPEAGTTNPPLLNA